MIFEKPAKPMAYLSIKYWHYAPQEARGTKRERDGSNCNSYHQFAFEK